MNASNISNHPVSLPRQSFLTAKRRNNPIFTKKFIAATIVLACGILGFEHPSQAQELYGVTGYGGTPSATLHLISQSDATVTPVLELNRNNGGQVIAHNPDDGLMYHWTGFLESNALLEKIDLETLSVTNIPLSGFESREIYSATYDPLTGAFLTSDINRHLVSVTTDGVRTDLGTTENWVRGLAFVGDTLYGGHNGSAADELYSIDPTNGDFLSTTPVTLDGYTVTSFAAQATNPSTGELWALLLVGELPRKTRVLTKIDPTTGVATFIGIMPDGSGFSSLAFVPAPVISVEIDIKPGSDPNIINPGSMGVIPVAIFSSVDFDATTVDPTTVTLAGATVALRGQGKWLAHEEDVDGDGLLDLVCKVETEFLDEDLDAGEVCLTGATFEGEQIKGCDFVILVPDDQ